MNDRFKYRVWDKSNEQYLDPEDMDCICLLPNGCFTVATWDGIQGDMKYWANEDIVVEMSTGLKDKNGNLIYEGDIVADGDVKRKVVWGGWYWNAKATCACPLDNITTRFVEIIGNIHEQAEQKD